MNIKFNVTNLQIYLTHFSVRRYFIILYKNKNITFLKQPKLN